MSDAKLNLERALAFSGCNSPMSVAQAIEALIDERIKGPKPKPNTELTEQFRRMREEINQGTG